MSQTSSDWLFRVAYFWNESMLEERTLPTPEIVKLGAEEMFPLPDGVVGGSSLPVFAPRGAVMELIATESVTGWVVKNGRRQAIDQLDERTEIAPGDYGVACIGTVALYFQWVPRGPAFPSSLPRIPFALVAGVLFACMFVGSAAALAMAERGPKPDRYHLDRSWVTRFVGKLPRRAVIAEGGASTSNINITHGGSATKRPRGPRLSTRSADQWLANTLRERSIGRTSGVQNADPFDPASLEATRALLARGGEPLPASAQEQNGSGSSAAGTSAAGTSAAGTSAAGTSAAGTSAAGTSATGTSPTGTSAGVGTSAETARTPSGAGTGMGTVGAGTAARSGTGATGTSGGSARNTRPSGRTTGRTTRRATPTSGADDLDPEDDLDDEDDDLDDEDDDLDPEDEEDVDDDLDEEDRAYERERRGGSASGMALGRSAVDRIVRTHRAAVQFCFEQAQERDPDLAGRVLATWRVNTDGSVSAARIASSSLNSRGAEACIVRQIRRWRFPRPSSETQASHTWSFR